MSATTLVHGSYFFFLKGAITIARPYHQSYHVIFPFYA